MSSRWRLRVGLRGPLPWLYTLRIVPIPPLSSGSQASIVGSLPGSPSLSGYSDFGVKQGCGGTSGLMKAELQWTLCPWEFMGLWGNRMAMSARKLNWTLYLGIPLCVCHCVPHIAQMPTHLEGATLLIFVSVAGPLAALPLSNNDLWSRCYHCRNAAYRLCRTHSSGPELH